MTIPSEPVAHLAPTSFVATPFDSSLAIDAVATVTPELLDQNNMDEVCSVTVECEPIPCLLSAVSSQTPNNPKAGYASVSIFKTSRKMKVGVVLVDDAETRSVLVDRIEFGSIFHETPLNVGQTVLSINQVQVRSARTGNMLLKTMDQWLTITTRIGFDENCHDHVTTYVKKRVPDQRLGVKFLIDPDDGALVVSRLDNSGILPHLSLLRVGDVVLSVNRREVGDMSVEDAVKVLNEDPSTVRLETKTENGVVVISQQAAPLSRQFKLICAGIVILIIVLMCVIFYFARSDNDCMPFCNQDGNATSLFNSGRGKRGDGTD